jgi:hypothetical protein
LAERLPCWPGDDHLAGAGLSEPVACRGFGAARRAASRTGTSGKNFAGAFFAEISHF